MVAIDRAGRIVLYGLVVLSIIGLTLLGYSFAPL